MTRDVPPARTPAEAQPSAPTVAVAPPLVVVPVDAADETPWTYPSRRTLARWLLVAIALYIVGWLLWNTQTALIPFIIGLVLAYLLNPIVNWFTQRRLPRWLSIVLVYLGGIILLVLGIGFIVPPLSNQVQQLTASIPPLDQLQGKVQEWLQEWRQTVPESVRQPVENAVSNALRSLQANATVYVQQLGDFAISQVLRVADTLSFLIGFFIVPFWLFYVLNDKDKGKKFLNQILHPRLRPDFWNVWQMIDKVFSSYIRGQLILGAAVGAAVGVGLLILRLLFGLDIKYILLLSIIAAITELVPVIGPIIGAIPGVLLAFLSGDDAVSNGLAVLAVYIIVQQLENNLLVPRIVGQSVGIHEAILTVLLIALGQIYGLLGVILAAPIGAIARDLFLYVYRRLGGESPAQSIHTILDEKSKSDTKPVNQTKAKTPIQA